MQVVKFYEKGYDSNKLIIQWNLGNTCNYSCEYCPLILHRGDRPWVELLLIEETLLKIKQRFSNKKIYVEFLGGEITLYKDFLGLMTFCKENNFENLIFTNGSRTFRHWEEVAPYLNKVLLTFHPHSASKEHFKSVLNILSKNNIDFYVHLVLVPEMLEETKLFFNELKELYTNKNISITLMMDKEHNKNYQGFFYNYSQEELDFVKEQSKSSERYIIEYHDGSIKEFSLNEVKIEKMNSFKKFVCGADENLIVIDSRGFASTSLCRQKNRINIYDGNLDDLFSKSYCPLEICENPSDIRIYKSMD
jgi:pyruvate-formate lyase-activating enzyme